MRWNCRCIHLGENLKVDALAAKRVHEVACVIRLLERRGASVTPVAIQ